MHLHAFNERQPDICKELKAKASGLLHMFEFGEMYLWILIGAAVFGILEKPVRIASVREATIRDVLETMELFLF